MALLIWSILTFISCPFGSSSGTLLWRWMWLYELFVRTLSFYRKYFVFTYDFSLFPGLPLAPFLDGCVLGGWQFFPFNLVTRLGSCKSSCLLCSPPSIFVFLCYTEDLTSWVRLLLFPSLVIRLYSATLFLPWRVLSLYEWAGYMSRRWTMFTGDDSDCG